MVTEEELIKFEEEIADEFLNKKILAPIHLSGDNEKQLIDIFKDIKKEDWILTTHRNHYHALLKGMPKSLVKRLNACMPS